MIILTDQLLTWFENHRGLAAWFSGTVTATALGWSLIVASANARKANARATANLLAADDAMAAVQDYLESLLDGHPKGALLDRSDRFMSTAPFNRFQREMEEVDISNLPSQWCRRSIRRARAVVAETGEHIVSVIDATRFEKISAEDLTEVLHQIEICRDAISPDLPTRTPWSWARAAIQRLRRPHPTRLSYRETG